MSRLLSLFYGSPLAILPELVGPIRAVLERHAAGERLSAAQIAAAIGDAPARAQARRGQAAPAGVAVLPLIGILSQRGGVDQASSALTSTDATRRAFRELMDDDRVGTIVLDVDSPGGSVAGTAELANEIYAARGRKRVVAVANSLAASAAYWVATAADELVVTSGGEVGSIGVITAHEDHSRELDQRGVDVTLVTAGKYKGEGSPFGPLGADAREALQKRVDEYYGQFVSAVARHRGVDPSEVRNGFGEGRVVSAREAVSLGMADRIDTLDGVLDSVLQRRRGRSASARALDLLELEQ